MNPEGCHSANIWRVVANSSESPFEEISELIPVAALAIATVKTTSKNTFLLTTEGKLVVWGLRDSDKGQQDASNVFYQPTLVKQLERVPLVSISCGTEHILALDGNSYVWSWGYNHRYQLGRKPDSEHSHNEPNRIMRINQIVKVAAGAFISFAASANGTVYAWGDSIGNLCELKGSDKDPRVINPTELAYSPWVESVHKEHKGIFRTPNKRQFEIASHSLEQIKQLQNENKELGISMKNYQKKISLIEDAVNKGGNQKIRCMWREDKMIQDIACLRDYIHKKKEKYDKFLATKNENINKITLELEKHETESKQLKQKKHELESLAENPHIDSIHVLQFAEIEKKIGKTAKKIEELTSKREEVARTKQVRKNHVEIEDCDDMKLMRKQYLVDQKLQESNELNLLLDINRIITIHTTVKLCTPEELLKVLNEETSPEQLLQYSNELLTHFQSCIHEQIETLGHKLNVKELVKIYEVVLSNTKLQLEINQLNKSIIHGNPTRGTTRPCAENNEELLGICEKAGFSRLKLNLNENTTQEPLAPSPGVTQKWQPAIKSRYIWGSLN